MTDETFPDHVWHQVRPETIHTWETDQGSVTIRAHTERMRVPGGWLYREVERYQYRYDSGRESASVGLQQPVFVPSGA